MSVVASVNFGKLVLIFKKHSLLEPKSIKDNIGTTLAQNWTNPMKFIFQVLKKELYSYSDSFVCGA